MALYTHRNVIVGAAALFISAKDSNDPSWGSGPVLTPAAITASGATAKVALEGDTANWKTAGYTTDGIEVSYEPDYGEVTVDQALDSVKMFKQGMRVSVNTTLSEATLENLIIAWGQKANTLSGGKVAISGGELGDDPVERSLAFVGNAPRTVSATPAQDNLKQERVYHLRRSLQVESSAHSLSRSDATTFPVSFRCLPDANFTSGGDYGQIIQRVLS